MDTRSHFRRKSGSASLNCVYCGCDSDTSDHTPPQCFLRAPLPSNLITVPACKACNSGFSFHENLVKAVVALTSLHPDLIVERQPTGRVGRSLARDARLRSVIENAKRPDGNYELAGELLASFDCVIRKTVQGLFFGLYERFVDRNQLEVIQITDQRFASPEQVADHFRPPPLRDITDEPLPDLTPSSWPLRDPIFFMEIQPVSGGEPVQRLFRLVRDSPVEWVVFQPDVFRFAFVKGENGRAVCVMDVWKTLVAAVSVPWPDRRGPLRKGKKNPMSRDVRRRGKPQE